MSLLANLLVFSLFGSQDEPIYLDPSKPVEARVEDLLGRMTFEEKISMLHGDSKFTTAAIPRLGLPRRWMSDGPHGVREDVGPDTWNPAGHTDDFATYMPVNICLASTWNPQEWSRRFVLRWTGYDPCSTTLMTASRSKSGPH